MTADRECPGNEQLNIVVHDLLEGLITDGESRKQYFLEKALRSLCEDAWVDQAWQEFCWVKGVAP